MRAANWKDYELLDTSAGERLERWGEVILIRPDPQIIWNTPKQLALWKQLMPATAVPVQEAGRGRFSKRFRLFGKSVMVICVFN